MEQIYLRLHIRLIYATDRFIGRKFCRGLEYFTLSIAILSLLSLALFHVSYIERAGSPQKDRRHCVQHLMPPPSEFKENYDIARIEVVDDDSILDVYSYARLKGYLMFPDQLHEKHNIRMLNVKMPLNSTCFQNLGPVFKHVIGFDTIVINKLVLRFDGRGYLYNEQTKEFFNLNYVDNHFRPTGIEWVDFLVHKIGVFASTWFLFFSTSTLVSFTLRTTQHRMMKFTVLLRANLLRGRPYWKLVFLHVIESLTFVPIMVGFLFVLFEFFGDQFLSFAILSLVWLCELFAVISVRTSASLKYFPRYFMTIFSAFHCYCFSFPFGFSYTALFTAYMFTGFLMQYFWNNWEIPAYYRRIISMTTPRQIEITDPI